jgi:hypothetical protein
MQRLNFIIPIYNVKVKVRVGNIEKIIEKYDANIEAPCAAFQQSYEGFELIALPKDYDSYLSHECGHTACAVVRHLGMKVSSKTEEFIFYLQDYLIQYIKENL